MNGPLYTGASGLMLAERRLELAAHNLANSSTAGYRPQRAFAQTLAAVENSIGANRVVAAAGTWEPSTPGALRPTGQPLDVALPDGLLLAVETAAGPRYTRAGALQIDDRGQLADAAGNPIHGDGGAPIVGVTVTSRIAADGRVFEGEAQIGRLRVVRDPDGVLTRAGDNLFDARGADNRLADEPNATLRVGWLEDSATDAVQELVRLVEAQRAFERFQRIISLTANDVNRRAVNDIAG